MAKCFGCSLLVRFCLLFQAFLSRKTFQIGKIWNWRIPSWSVVWTAAWPLRCGKQCYMATGESRATNQELFSYLTLENFFFLILQRYFTNSSFFKRDGPVFLQIGGEGEASPKWVVKGMMMEWANKFNALTFQLEHRFYGKSHPTEYANSHYCIN